MENEMLKIRLQSLQQHQTNKTSDQKEEEEESSSPPQQDWTANKKSTSTYFGMQFTQAKQLFSPA